MRYRFEVFYSIEVDPDEVCMLRFLLQPIVENACIARPGQKGRAGDAGGVRGSGGGALILRVSDDGAGMTQEELAQLQRRLSELPGAERGVKHVGVWNIHQRIRLAHGEPYGVEVYSRPGQGSTFTLRLPLITKGMIADETL
jgi:sensor histidine kinase YesM